MNFSTLVKQKIKEKFDKRLLGLRGAFTPDLYQQECGYLCGLEDAIEIIEETEKDMN